MIRLITPLQRDDRPRQFGDQPRLMNNNVPPEHHRPPAGRDKLVNPSQKIQINPRLSLVLPLAAGYAP